MVVPIHAGRLLWPPDYKHDFDIMLASESVYFADHSFVGQISCNDRYSVISLWLTTLRSLHYKIRIFNRNSVKQGIAAWDGFSRYKAYI